MATFRFYAELNDFLAPARRGVAFEHATSPHESLKHAVESLGVPHTEVALVLLNGEPTPLERRSVAAGDRIAVYPQWHLAGVCGSADEVDEPRFICDAHLGRLARYLRFAGYDTLYRNAWQDVELVALARAETRIVLTRDRDLLMHRDVVHGCYLRAVEPLQQLQELQRRLGLSAHEAGTGSRCLLCNAVLETIDKAAVAGRVPPRTFAHFEQYWRCPCCERVYWRGSHWERMSAARPPEGARSGVR
ncbi:Mut7-C RNAse domain-containing protein [Caldimonas brevitalea]|uniref:Twitching motility protein PilT n=1 Tax=Caldimonas brevitalea TaxID=413882 RepID=A0A0G3BF08_9BURK|nr:Mut7-C RNAse domain-containing protein [Caldimonas brevitalea]AKJ28009.1 hypothetical protein AAW51_1318 [Caldimonas brevitalea]